MTNTRTLLAAAASLLVLLPATLMAMLPPDFPDGPPHVYRPGESQLKFTLMPGQELSIAGGIKRRTEGFIAFSGAGVEMELSGNIFGVQCTQVDDRITICTFIGTGRADDKVEGRDKLFGTVYATLRGASVPVEVTFLSLLVQSE
ncbi:MAG: hypothetical protein AAGA68_20815 [Pseudomonadota bacterium]